MTTTEGRIVTEGGGGSIRRVWFVGTVIVAIIDRSLIGEFMSGDSGPHRDAAW